MSAHGETVPLDEGWTLIREKAIDRLEYYLNTGKVPKDVVQVEGKPPRIFGAGDYAQLYTTVYNMCTQRSPNNWSEELYQRYGESMASYVTKKVVPKIEGLEGEALLKELLLRWNNHKLYSKWMERFFTYLDRYYVKLQSVDTLAVRSVTIFKTLAFDHGHVPVRCRTAILEMINIEREGTEVDQGLLRGVVDMLFDLGNASRSSSASDGQGSSSSSSTGNRPTLGAAPVHANDELGSTLWVYQQELEEYLLPETDRFYERQAKAWLVGDSLPEYLVKAESALMAEQKRVETYLHPSSMQKIKNVVIKATLANTMSQTLEKDTSITWMLDNDRREDLSRLWRLFGLVNNGLVPIAASFKQYVQDYGNSVVDVLLEQLKALGPQPSPQAKAEILADPSFVQKLVDMHDRFKSIVAECFQSDGLFQKSLKEAFETFINRDLGRFSVAAMMSSFCDKVLRKGGEKRSEEQVDALMSKLVDLFSFLTDKDVFAEIYRNQLAKRLLYDTSASDEAEKNVIQKLKMKCGAQFTSKLEGMITDISLAADMQKQFREYLSHRDSQADYGNIDFSVTVLTTGFWPTYHPIDNVVLPTPMTRCLSVFTDFYNGRTQHRKLSWIHTLGQAVVGARFGPKKHDLNCSTLQALILLLFNNPAAYGGDSDGWISFGDIHTATGCGDDILCKKLLATLSIARYKVLEKSGSNPRVIDVEEKFRVNPKFSCPQRKIKIPPPAQDETHKAERVQEDRSISIEAAIVRIMKTRKTCSHQQLVSEVLSQLSFFKPNPKVIKQRIEHLIEREYLERDENQPNVYRYLA